MSNHTTLTTLFTALHGSLPYEYDELLVNNEGPDQIIVISKPDTERTIYITANIPDDNGVLDVATYDDAYDDDLVGIYLWDTNDPDLDLVDLIAYIEKSL